MLRSGLVSEARLQAELKELQTTGSRGIGAAERIANHFMAKRLITAWQAEKLLQGRYRGFILGNYRLLDQLGRGGMSVVYVGEHRRMQRKVAIKVLPKSRVRQKAYLERFLAEARAAAALSHPNIVRAYDFDSAGDTHFLVMECLEGNTLSQLVASAHPLPISDVVSYISQAAKGLQHAHAEGLVHRDVKPANLMITSDGQLKVLDMGLARLAHTADETSPIDSGAGVMGTADYLAPEQARNSDDVDQRADVYALGGTLYFALAGQPPFPGGTIADKIVSHQREEPEPLVNFRGDCPQALARLCRGMMAKDPDQRLSSMDQVVKELSKVEVFGLPEATSVPASPKLITGDMDKTTHDQAHTSPDASTDEFATVGNHKFVATRKPRKVKRSLPVWIWIAMIGLIVMAIWLASKISQQGGLGL